MKKEILNQIWESFNYTSIEYLDKEFDNIAPLLLEYLIIALIESKEACIGISKYEEEESSEITYDFYDSNKELSLRLVKGNTFTLILSIYDAEGELKNYSYMLDIEEQKIIPPGLKDLMREVLANKKPAAFKLDGLRN